MSFSVPRCSCGRRIKTWQRTQFYERSMCYKCFSRQGPDRRIRRIVAIPEPKNGANTIFASWLSVSREVISYLSRGDKASAFKLVDGAAKALMITDCQRIALMEVIR